MLSGPEQADDLAARGSQALTQPATPGPGQATSSRASASSEPVAHRPASLQVQSNFDFESEENDRENPTLSVRRQNPWNLFQHQMRNRGLNSQQLSALYKDFKKSNDR